MKTDIQELKETVIDGGYCVGCGVCSQIEESPITIKLDQYGKYQAFIPEYVDLSIISGEFQKVCPFSNKSLNEDEIGNIIFGESMPYHSKIGHYIATYAGYVTEGDFRERGSSGGMGSWIAFKLMEKGLVNGVIHVHSKQCVESDSSLFEYRISTTLEHVIDNSKSRYYPIELSEIIDLVKNSSGRFAFVGIPCFIKAIRLLQLENPILKEKIAYCIGLVCGHLKTSRFAEMFAWQCGIEPSNLKSIDFRTKIEGKNANQYGVTVTGLFENKIVKRTSPSIDQVYGANWGWGYFKYRSCDYCDDVVAETADISIGDAWLPQYVHDSEGTNVIVVRNFELASMLEDAVEENQIKLDIISADDIVLSQRSGFEHRREGLAYRLDKMRKQKKWYPKKRVNSTSVKVSRHIAKKQECRILLAENSHLAFESAIKGKSFQIFVSEMKPYVDEYSKLYAQSLIRRIKRKVIYILKKVI